MRISRAPRSIILLLLTFVPWSGHAQWMTQRIPLLPGWNAVHIQVQPEPNACDDIFRNLPVESVWKWNRRFKTAQFDLDPKNLLPEDPDWSMWMPPTDKRAFLRRLYELQGNQSYLIKVASNAVPFTLSVKGRVTVPRVTWYPHSLNLVGLPVNPKNPPTFSDFFRFTREVDTTLGYANELYKVDTAGRGIRIVQPARDRLQPGVAYWIACARAPEGKSAIDFKPPGDGVDFGALLNESTVYLRNRNRTNSIAVKVRLLASESAPLTGGHPELAGPVPLSYLTRDEANQRLWALFPEAGVSKVLAPGEEWALQLGLRRSDFEPYVPQRENGWSYQSILEVTDGPETLLIHVPVVASARPLMAMALPGHSDQEGLWVGQAAINQVSAPAYTDELLPTPTPATLRLLLHVDGYGRVNLLQQVLVGWDTTSSTYVLCADQRSAGGLKDVNRVSSVTLPRMNPLPLASSSTNELPLNATVFGMVTNRFDDPTNPFLHRYHPLHDNKDWDFKSYDGAVETRTVIRDITFEFSQATTNQADPFWGVDALSGTYKETLSGLRVKPIYVQGPFTLQRISRINTLRITP
jgi:hypothetical protein